MKKIFTYTAIIVMGLFVASCDMDVFPHDGSSTEEELIISNANYLGATPYMYLRSDEYLGFLYIAAEAMTDNLTMCSAGRNTNSEWHNYLINGTTFGTQGFWMYVYSAILSVNTVIEELQEYENFDIKDPQYALKILSNNILAEAYALRGMMHYDLVKIFGKPYTFATASDLGVPYKLNTEVNLPARDPVVFVYEQAVADFEKALSLMKSPYNDNRTRLNRNSINALLARVLISMSNGNDTWTQRALVAANAAISGDGSDIASIADFPKIWTTTMSGVKEVLCRIVVNESDDEAPGMLWGQGQNSSSGFKSEYVVSYNFFNEFSNNDVRKNAYIATANYSGNMYNMVAKWWGRTGEVDSKVDYPLIRTSEVYLIKAEALHKIGNDAEALATLNLLRAKRYSPFTPGSETGTQLFSAIMRERRFELAFEGQHYFDIKRLGLPVDRDGKGDFADGTGTPSITQHVSAHDPRFQLPIPLSELQANPNMKQNQY